MNEVDPQTQTFEADRKPNSMHLTEHEREIREGKHGKAARMAMEIMTDLGRLYGAERLLPVSQVHIDATIYLVDAGVDFAERMVEWGGRVAVPTTLNPSAIDLAHWEEYRATPQLLERSRRLERAYMAMGAAPTWTCTPYQTGIVPRFGEQIAWGESNAIAFANSILGARTNRYADLMDICAAVLGKVPAFGLHLSDKRKADMIIRLGDVPAAWYANPALIPLIGYVVGELAGDRIAAVSGLPVDLPTDSLKAFCAAAASSGAVGLVHLEGISPEARVLEACLADRAVIEETRVTPARIRKAEQRLSSSAGDHCDLVVLGCPHLSFAEFLELVRLMEGRTVHTNVVFWAVTSRAVYQLIRTAGILKRLENSGVMVFQDACPLQYPKEGWRFLAAMTNSAKFATYCYSQTGLVVSYAGTRDCVTTAVQGHIHRAAMPWK
jgi:predicted aconitase